MGKAIPEQHPAVVLRSHYNHLRALVIAALIAVLGLAGAVVIVNDDDTVVSTSTPAIEGSADIIPGVNLPARPGQAQAFPGQSQQVEGIGQARPGTTRYDGGPNEGSADVTAAKPGVMARPGTTRYDGGPEEGTAALTQRSAPATFDPNSIKEAPGVRYDGGPEEGSADVTTGHLRGSAPVMPQSDGFRYGGSN